MKKIAFFIFSIIPIICCAQSWQWASSENYDSYISDPNIITTDVNGNTFIGNRSYYTGIHIIKYDILGTKLWEKVYNGGSVGPTSLCTDESANLYAVFWATNVEGVTYDPSQGAVLFAKYDPNGNLVWIKQITYRLLLAERTDSNDILIGNGTYTDTIFFENGDTLTVPAGAYKYFMAKYDINGDCIWSQEDDGGQYPIIQNQNKEMFTSGEVQWGMTVGQDTNQTALNPSDGFSFFIKYDSVGSLEWVQQGSGQFIGDNYGNGYVSRGVGNNLYLKKYDSYGNFLWQRTHFYSPSWYKYKMKCDAQGNILFTGGFSNSLTIDDTTITVSGLKSFVAKIDSSGTLKWVTISSGGSAGAKDISIGDDGAIYITGDMSGTVCFGPHCTTQPSGVFAAKLLDVDLTGVKEHPAEEVLLSVSPNPGSGIFTVTYENPLTKKLRLEIHNSTGQTVWSCNENSCGNSFKKIVDLSKQSKGIYFLQVLADGKKRSVKKIVLN